MSALDVCPTQFGRVEVRLIRTGSSKPTFSTVFLCLEDACFKWYEDPDRNICKGVAFLINKSETIKDDVVDPSKGKMRVLRCQVSIQTGPALFDLRVKHSKVWQLAIDTHFSRCAKTLSMLPAYAYDLDDARFSSLHLSTVAKIAVSGVNYDIPINIIDDVAEKVNVLFPPTSPTMKAVPGMPSMSSEVRREVTSTLMKAQNDMVHEVVRRFHHLETANQQLQRSLASMTDRAINAEVHSETLASHLERIEDLMPHLQRQVTSQTKQQQGFNDVNPAHDGHTMENRPLEPHYMGHTFSSVKTQSWRQRSAETEQALIETRQQLESAERQLQQLTHPSVLSNPLTLQIQALQNQNQMLREVTSTMREEIVELHEQLNDIQQAALQNIESLHASVGVENTATLSAARALAEASAASLEEQSTVLSVDLSGLLLQQQRQQKKHQQQIPRQHLRPLDLVDREEDEEDEEDGNIVPKSNNNSRRIVIDDLQHEQSQDVDREADSTDDDESNAYAFPGSSARKEVELDSMDTLLLEEDNWTNKYQDYLTQVSVGAMAAATGNKTSYMSSPTKQRQFVQQNPQLVEVVQSLGWSLCEERMVAMLYNHYLSVPYTNHNYNVISGSGGSTHNNGNGGFSGMSLTKFQRFLKDFHILALANISTNHSNTATNNHNSQQHSTFSSGMHDRRSGRSAPTANQPPDLMTGLLDKQLTHSDVSAIFTVACSARVVDDPSTSNAGGNNSINSSGAFKVNGGHRSAADALDFYHYQLMFSAHAAGTNTTSPGHSTANTVVVDNGALQLPSGTVTVHNTASATLSLAQFRWALALVAEKIYAKVLFHATGTSPEGLAGKEKAQAMRAMLELLWIKTLAPVALSMDLVPQPLLALRLFLVHMHSDVLHLENLVQMEQQQKATTAKSSGPYSSTKLRRLLQRYLPDRVLTLCTQPALLRLLAWLARSYCASPSTQSGKHNPTASTSSAGNGQHRDFLLPPLGMEDMLATLDANAYLRHPWLVQRLRLSFATFRALCLDHGLVPYLLGEHQLYALFCEVANLLQQQQQNSGNGKSSSMSKSSGVVQNKSASRTAGTTGHGPGAKSPHSDGYAHADEDIGKKQQEQRYFPSLTLPALLLENLVEADKVVVVQQRLRDQEDLLWRTQTSISHTSHHLTGGSGGSSNSTTTTVDLVGVVTLIGALAMKVFPHVPPAQRLDNLFALLRQNAALTGYVDSVADSHTRRGEEHTI